MFRSLRKGTATRAKFRARELHAQVLLLQRLDRIPVELEFLGDILDGGLATAPPHVLGKALGIEGVVRQKVEPIALHVAATLAQRATHLDRQKNTCVTTREFANVPRVSAVPARLESTTAPKNVFFERRTGVMTRAFESPKTPRSVGCGRKAGNAYASHSRRCLFAELATQTRCPIQAACEIPER
jgi:hypothetical protein